MTIPYAVSFVTGITPSEMRSKTRKQPIAEARFMAMLLEKARGDSAVEIGARWGKHRNTVLAACARAADLAETDLRFCVRLHRAAELANVTKL